MGALQGIRPLFDKAWAASEIIYNNADNPEERRQRVANIIGGQVAYNINHPDPQLRWKNTCGDIVSMDAGSSVSALIEWTYYNMDKSIDEEIRIIDSYLSRNYLNPLAEAEIKGIKFDFLKCLDLYHSKDLDKLAKKMIEHPQNTFRSTIRNYYRDLNRKK